MGWIAKIMLQGSKQASREAQLDILARAWKAELHACRGWNVHACRGSGMECRGGARRRGGVRDGCTHWALSLGQPDIFGAAKGFRSRVGGCQGPAGPWWLLPPPGWQQLSQVSAQPEDRVVKRGGGKGYTHIDWHQDRGVQEVQMRV